jgi:beta-phosphoglucomutase
MLAHTHYKAFLFDLNGTMINDMPYHVKAWHGILNGLGANISIERMKEECYGKNHELLERIFPGRFSEQEKDRMIYKKEEEYQHEFRPHLQLIPGLREMLEKAHAKGIRTAIGSAAIMFNVDFVLDGLHIRHLIDAIVSADDVVHSKPDPETFLKCANALHIKPEDCLVIEDAPKGAESALNAGMDCLVITTMHEPGEFSKYKNVKGFINDFTDDLISQLL